MSPAKCGQQSVTVYGGFCQQALVLSKPYLDITSHPTPSLNIEAVIPEGDAAYTQTRYHLMLWR